MTASAETQERFAVDLPSGPAEVSADLARPATTRASVVIAHGAGAGYRHPFLVGFARALNSLGIATLRFNFPYLEAGRRMPGPPGSALAAWAAAMAFAQERAAGAPVWASGKSYGGRMASVAAAQGLISPAGLVYLGYPLHPPGNPVNARTAHLPAVRQPQLFVSGARDPFVDPHAQLEEAVASCRDASIAWVDGGHSFEVKGRRRPADDVGADLAPLVAAFMFARD